MLYLIFAAVVPGFPIFLHEGGRVHRLAPGDRDGRRRRGEFRTLQPWSLGSIAIASFAIKFLQEVEKWVINAD